MIFVKNTSCEKFEGIWTFGIYMLSGKRPFGNFGDTEEVNGKHVIREKGGIREFLGYLASFKLNYVSLDNLKIDKMYEKNENKKWSLETNKTGFQIFSFKESRCFGYELQCAGVKNMRYHRKADKNDQQYF